MQKTLQSCGSGKEVKAKKRMHHFINLRFGFIGFISTLIQPLLLSSQIQITFPLLADLETHQCSISACRQCFHGGLICPVSINQVVIFTFHYSKHVRCVYTDRYLKGLVCTLQNEGVLTLSDFTTLRVATKTKITAKTEMFMEAESRDKSHIVYVK